MFVVHVVRFAIRFIVAFGVIYSCVHDLRVFFFPQFDFQFLFVSPCSRFRAQRVFGRHNFAGVNWQVAKRTKVFVSKHEEASSGGRGQDKNQKKKNRPVEAKGKKRQNRVYNIHIYNKFK